MNPNSDLKNNENVMAANAESSTIKAANAESSTVGDSALAAITFSILFFSIFTFLLY